MRYRTFSYKYTIEDATHSSRQDWRTSQLNMIAKPCWQPLADLYATSDAIYITTELPGTAIEDIDISLYENALIISGVRTILTDVSECVYLSAEIRQGPFRLEIVLPSMINPEKVEARYDLGLLRVVLPKK